MWVGVYYKMNKNKNKRVTDKKCTMKFTFEVGREKDTCSIQTEIQEIFHFGLGSWVFTSV